MRLSHWPSSSCRAKQLLCLTRGLKMAATARQLLCMTKNLMATMTMTLMMMALVMQVVTTML